MRRSIPDTILFIDLDNLAITLRQTRGREFDLPEVVAAAGGLSRMLEIRLYADVNNLSDGFRRYLTRFPLALIDVPSRSNGRPVKDAVDRFLALDALEAALLRRDVRRIALAAGDGYYARLLGKVLQHGKGIAVVSVEEALSTDLRELAGDDLALLEGGRSFASLPPAERSAA